MNNVTTVDIITSYLDKKLKDNPLIADIQIQGEVVNFRNHKHLYQMCFFDLGGDNSNFKRNILHCFLPDKNELPQDFDEGIQVIVRGSIQIYGPSSSYQMVVKQIEIHDETIQKKKFELLKLKLEHEGLFDPRHKKELPKTINKVCLLTAKGSAAYTDFVHRLYLRNPLIEIYFIPVYMQGQNTIRSIIDAFNIIEHQKYAFDVIVLTRGGGSSEELSVFNDETLVREIFKLPIPIVTAIGHEIDTTLAELVSDFRSSTPTSAAEFVSFKTLPKYKTDLQGYGNKISENFTWYIQKLKKKISDFSAKTTSLSYGVSKQRRLLNRNSQQLLLSKFEIFKKYRKLLTETQILLKEYIPQPFSWKLNDLSGFTVNPDKIHTDSHYLLSYQSRTWEIKIVKEVTQTKNESAK